MMGPKIKTAKLCFTGLHGGQGWGGEREHSGEKKNLEFVYERGPNKACHWPVCVGE